VVKTDPKRLNWAFFWASVGAAAVLTLAAPGLSAWSISALLAIAGVAFTTSAHQFRRLNPFIFLFIWGAASLLGYELWPPPNGRHLNQAQKVGLAKLRDGLPDYCGMLVYVPVESKEAQAYGKEIDSALTAHGKKANLIIAGAFEPPSGLVVGVRSELDRCGRAGEDISFELTHHLNMPARIQESFPFAAETVVVLFVGLKPLYN
jgi:hypothetical protein